MSTRALSGLGLSVKTWQSFHWCINMHASSPQSSRECNGRLAMPGVLTCSICNHCCRSETGPVGRQQAGPGQGQGSGWAGRGQGHKLGTAPPQSQ